MAGSFVTRPIGQSDRRVCWEWSPFGPAFSVVSRTKDKKTIERQEKKPSGQFSENKERKLWRKWKNWWGYRLTDTSSATHRCSRVRTPPLIWGNLQKVVKIQWTLMRILSNMNGQKEGRKKKQRGERDKNGCKWDRIEWVWMLFCKYDQWGLCSPPFPTFTESTDDFYSHII